MNIYIQCEIWKYGNGYEINGWIQITGENHSKQFQKNQIHKNYVQFSATRQQMTMMKTPELDENRKRDREREKRAAPAATAAFREGK